MWLFSELHLKPTYWVKFVMHLVSQRRAAQLQKDVLIIAAEKYFYLVQLSIFLALRYDWHQKFDLYYRPVASTIKLF